MKALQDELKDLQKKRQEIEVAMSDANETLQQAQHTLGEAGSRRNELAAKITPLQRLMNDLTTSQSAIEQQRQAAVPEIEAAEKFHDEQLLPQIGKELPAARSKAIQVAIEAVDTTIDDLKKSVQALQHRIAEAEAAVIEAQKQTAAHEKGFREALAELRQLPGQIQAARGQVANLSTAAKAAATSRRTEEAFYLARELKQALDRLSQLVGKGQEDELFDRLNKEWEESKAINASIAEKTTALKQLRDDLATAERELQRKVQQREADIKAALTVGEMAETTRAGQQTEPPAQRKTGGRSREADQ